MPRSLVSQVGSLTMDCVVVVDLFVDIENREAGKTLIIKDNCSQVMS
jgi:hypothetical protein